MPRLLVRNLSISLDGYVAGPHQDLDNPLGVGGMQLHDWLFATRSGNRMIGKEGGSEGLDNDFFSGRGSGVGATIMGRNMFGPTGGERIPLSITRSSYSLTTHVPLLRCRGAQPSISLTAGSKQLSVQPSTQRVAVMSLSEVAQPQSGNTFVFR
jgi:dihydrofolate reductase